MNSATDRKTALLGHYANEGIKLVRLSGSTRKPIDTAWQRETIPLEDVCLHVRRGGGVGWQCGEASGWICAVDNDWPEARVLAPEFLPETLRAAKGSEEPSHYAYKSVGLGYKTFKGLDGSEIISLKASNNGAGHQVVVEPTIHPKKGPYHFVGGFNPAAIAVIDAGELRQRVGMHATAALIARYMPKAKDEGGGGRHELALALSGYMLRNGEALEDVEKILAAAWGVRKASREALEDVRRSVRDTAARLARNEPATGGRRLEELIPGMSAKIADFLGWERADMREQRASYWLTDLGNAERFVDTNRYRVLWCPARKAWLIWNGVHWEWDTRGQVRKLAHKVARGIHKDAVHEGDPAKQREIAKFARASQNESRIGAMLNEAKPYLAVSMEELDRNPWLINCRNGTLDLRTGRLREHDPVDLITRAVPVEYDPQAECPRFQQYLRETILDHAVVSFVKRYSGYTLTGVTRERLFAILWGSGKNGKTTLVELLQDVLGDYARNTDVETILARKYAGVGNDVAALKGARLVSCAEVERGRRLAESKVKQLTGSDTVTARFLFGEPFDFRPQFKLWLSTNNRPEIKGTDDAIWDRIRLVPFTQRFDGERQDPKLAEKLREELAGVFAWMVEGCLEWQEHGLGEPAAVRDATDQYRTEMDTLAAFLEEECVVAEGAHVLAEKLYEIYAIWCDKSGEHKEAKKAFAGRLKERGFAHKRATRGAYKGRYIWLGIGFRGGSEPPDDDGEPEDGKHSIGEPTDPSPGPTSGHEHPSGGVESGSQGSPSEPTSTEGSPRESGVGMGDSSRKQGIGERSEPTSQKVLRQLPREEKVSDFDFTGFTGFTPGDENPPKRPPRRLTDKETEEVKRLMATGMSPPFARAAVLGEEVGP